MTALLICALSITWALIIAHYIGISRIVITFEREQPTKKVESESDFFGQPWGDVLAALIAQGAKPAKARAAVTRVLMKSPDASFEIGFRAALRELWDVHVVNGGNQ